MKAIFFTSISESYKYVFETNGFTALFIEPLQFKYINLSVLADKCSSSEYNGVILTSPRAIEALSKSLNQDELSLWRDRRVYTVGEASGNKIKDLLNLSATGMNSGNAENLADVIKKENSVGSKFLFPCGNLKTETLIEKLQQNGLLVEHVTVYETEENKNLKSNLSSLMQDEEIVLLFFFSPSGVQFVVSHLKSMDTDISKILIFAIGNTTCKKLIEMGMKVRGVASKPNAASLLEAVNDTLHSKLDINY